MRQASESAAEVPLVSVGLPVFNGEAFLEDAIRSALAQTLDDLELILCDNASTDRTPEICSDYAARDPRVRYFRNPRNLGAAANYNLAFSHARGRYFKWLAHDDRMLPSFLAKAYRILEERADAVLCNTVVSYIDSSGAQIGLYDSKLSGADSFSPSARFAWMVLRSHTCVDFFGLIRREALRDSLLHGSFHGADRALLAQLSLRGRMLQLPAPLLAVREHPNRYTRAQRRSPDRAAWHDSARGGQASFPTWRLYGEYLRMVRRESLTPTERSRCYAVLARWWAYNWNVARAAVDLLAVAAPSAPAQAERLKNRLFGAAPGHLLADRRR
jgi:glycosyltransferase involved in cell wall biosynthesis